MKHSPTARARFTIFAAALTATLVLAGCTPAQETPVADVSELDLSDVTITFGEQSTEASPFILESGVLDDAPYTVEFASFSAPADNLAANASGGVDISHVAEWTGLQASANTQPAWTSETALFKNVLPGAQGNADDFDAARAIVTTASGFDSLEETKGARWGFIPNSYWALFAARALDSLGWTEDDVEIVHLDIPASKLALQTGEIDVSFAYSSNVADLEEQGVIKTVGFGTNDFDLPFNAALWANSASLADEKKNAAIEDFVSRYIEYQHWYATHPDEVQAVAISANKAAPAAALAAWQYNRRQPGPVTAEVLASAQSQLSLASSVGLIKTDPDAATFFYDGFTDTIEATLERLNYAEDLKNSYK